MSKSTWSDRDLDLEEARLLQRKLREVFNSEQPFAEESMRAVTRICDRALVTVDDDYCQEMFCEVDRHAQKLYATGRCDRRRIGRALDAINQRLGSLRTLRAAGGLVARAAVTLEKS